MPKVGVPAGAQDADLLISMGGSMSVNDPLPWIAEEIELLERRIYSGRRLVGVCLGSQLIAKAAGGRVEPGRAFEIGFHTVELTEEGRADPVSSVLPPRLSVLQWHGEIFRDVPDAIPLARSTTYPVQAFRVGRAYGLLFHLEATLHSIAAMAHAFPDDLKRGGLSPAALLESAQRDLPVIHEHARRFLAEVLRAA